MHHVFTDMAKYSTHYNSESKHSKAKAELQDIFEHIFCSYEKTPDESFDFRFELSRALQEDEWEKIPNMLVIYTAEDGTFEGDIKD